MIYKLLIIFVLMNSVAAAAVIPYDPVAQPSVSSSGGFKTKSKYKTKARYFRRVEERMLREIREYFIRQSWRELEDPELRRRTFPDIPELNH